MLLPIIKYSIKIINKIGKFIVYCYNKYWIPNRAYIIDCTKNKYVINGLYVYYLYNSLIKI